MGDTSLRSVFIALTILIVIFFWPMKFLLVCSRQTLRHTGRNQQFLDREAQDACRYGTLEKRPCTTRGVPHGRRSKNTRGNDWAARHHHNLRSNFGGRFLLVG